MHSIDKGACPLGAGTLKFMADLEGFQLLGGECHVDASEISEKVVLPPLAKRHATEGDSYREPLPASDFRTEEQGRHLVTTTGLRESRNPKPRMGDAIPRVP